MNEPSRLPLWLLAGLTLTAALVLAPFAPWICLALWLGLFSRRIHDPLTRWLGGRAKLSAALTVSLLLVIAIPIAMVVSLLVFDAITLVQRLLDSREAYGMFSKLVGDNPEVDTAREALGAASGIVDLLMSQYDRALVILRGVAGATAKLVIGMLIMVTGMYGVLVEGSGWYRWIARHAPLTQVHFERFRDAFLETGRGLWWGIGGAGLIQSIIATVTYLALGVPSALPLGMLTLLFSVIPAIGTAIVWVPVAVGLAITGQTVPAIILAVVGALVIGSIDNLARPWLARRGELALPSWVVLISMFGGLAVLGGWGIVLGPLFVRFAKEALEISREAHDPATHSPATVADAPDGEPESVVSAGSP